jgi:hypothetical protein
MTIFAAVSFRFDGRVWGAFIHGEGAGRPTRVEARCLDDEARRATWKVRPDGTLEPVPPTSSAELHAAVFTAVGSRLLR